MKLILVLVLVLVLGLFSACGEPKPDTVNAASYSKNGIEFQYPGNWNVTEDQQTQSVHTLFVQSPGNALFIIQLYAMNDVDDVSEFARSFSQEANESQSSAIRSNSNFGAVETVDGYDSITEHVAVNALGQSVPHTRVYRRKSTPQGVYFLISQSPDEDQSTVGKGFQRIVETFKATAS